MLKARTLVIVLGIMGMGAQTKADGVELSLSVSADATKVYLGEPLRIRVQVTNVSDHDVRVPITWEEAGEGYFFGTITRQGGRSETWSFRPRGSIVCFMRHRVVTLSAGESYERFAGLLRIAHYQRPGIYVLNGKFESDGAAPNRITRKSIPCWKGSISARPLKIEVKKPPRKPDREVLKILSAPYGGMEKCFSFHDIWGLGLYGRTKYELHDRRYESVLEKYPDSVYAPYCRLCAAAHYLEWYDGLGGGYKKAVEYLNTLLKMDPPFRLADMAELTLARAYLAEAKHSRTAKPLERKALRAKAVLCLRNLVRKSPTLLSTRESKRLLTSLGADGRNPTSAPKNKKIK